MYQYGYKQDHSVPVEIGVTMEEYQLEDFWSS